MKTEKSHKEKKKSKVSDSTNLVIYNDDVNTFEFVTQTLIDVCMHLPEQAEQCTLIIHYKGRCVVRSGGFSDLKPMCHEILNRGLTASLE